MSDCKVTHEHKCKYDGGGGCLTFLFVLIILIQSCYHGSSLDRIEKELENVKVRVSQDDS